MRGARHLCGSTACSPSAAFLHLVHGLSASLSSPFLTARKIGHTASQREVCCRGAGLNGGSAALHQALLCRPCRQHAPHNTDCDWYPCHNLAVFRSNWLGAEGHEDRKRAAQQGRQQHQPRMAT